MNDYIVSFPGLGINNLHIHPEAFRLFGISIYMYGLLIAFAVLLGMFLSLRHSKKFAISQDDILDSLLVSIPLAIICARLYYVIFSWDLYKNNLLMIFDTRAGGLAFYGGVIGGILGVLIVCRVKKLKFSRLLDFMIPYIALGQAIGRWGNFFNQEAFGNNTKLPWGMISDQTRSYLVSLNNPALNPELPVHPTFLYEFLGNLIIFIILIYIRKRSKQPFETFSWYLLLYGTLRFFVESVRTDALYLWKTHIPVSMLLSGLMVLFALTYLGVTLSRSRKNRGETDASAADALPLNGISARDYQIRQPETEQAAAEAEKAEAAEAKAGVEAEKADAPPENNAKTDGKNQDGGPTAP